MEMIMTQLYHMAPKWIMLSSDSSSEDPRFRAQDLRFRVYKAQGLGFRPQAKYSIVGCLFLARVVLVDIVELVLVLKPIPTP